MKRYYDSPIIAAYMAKEFGLGYLSQLGNDIVINEWEGQVHWAVGCGHAYVGKFYLHPDSLSILEPMVGDVYDGGSDMGIVTLVSESDYDAICEKLPELRHSFSYPEMICDEGEYLAAAEHGWKVIQRNGTPFCWPVEESEGA